MQVKRFEEQYTPQMNAIYYHTIHSVNCRDYTPEELEAWAPKEVLSEESYQKDTERFKEINPFVAVEGDIVLGFAELEDGGHINCFFVHHEHQGRGVGKMLLDACISEARTLGYTRIIAEVSITARPFFLKCGFIVVRPVLCDISGMQMKYYDMELAMI